MLTQDTGRRDCRRIDHHYLGCWLLALSYVEEARISLEQQTHKIFSQHEPRRNILFRKEHVFVEVPRPKWNNFGNVKMNEARLWVNNFYGFAHEWRCCVEYCMIVMSQNSRLRGALRMSLTLESHRDFTSRHTQGYLLCLENSYLARCSPGSQANRPLGRSF